MQAGDDEPSPARAETRRPSPPARSLPGPHVAKPRDPARTAGADVIGLQGAIGNRAVAQLAQGVRAAEPAGDGGILQRRVSITFEDTEHELEELDTSTARIENVIATRDATAVSVENAAVGPAQRAHTTSNAVFQHLFVRLLDQKTWVQAWQALREQYVFLHTLLTAWYADATLVHGSNATVRNNLPGLIQQGVAGCDRELTRNGHPVAAGVWGARPKAGTEADWVYYNHLPGAPDGVDPATHLIKPWAPRLRSADVARLEIACDQWMLLRGQIPWTSVAADSYTRGDAAGPPAVETALAAHTAKVNLAPADARDIANAIIKTFDFFPTSFTAGRTTNHAAAVAARHVVEHIQYHRIRDAWRADVAAAFLDRWQAKITQEQATEDAATHASQAPKPRAAKGKLKAAKIEPGRGTTALAALLANWPAVTAEFDRVFLLLAAAAPSIP